MPVAIHTYVSVDELKGWLGISGSTQDTNLTYAITYFVNKNDEKFTPDTELTYLTRTVAEDIQKAIMANQTISGLAKNINVVNAGYSEELIEGQYEFMVYVVAHVKVLINRTNPKLVVG